MTTIKIKVLNKSDNGLPQYSNPGDAGCDVRAYLSEPVTIPAKSRGIIGTGLYVEIPFGYEIQVRPRSGLAAKYGITIGCDPDLLERLDKITNNDDPLMVLNNPGTIDCYYRGELKVILYNTGDSDFTINSGDRIAQLVVAEVKTISFEEISELDMTNDRGGGFGHTGVS